MITTSCCLSVYLHSILKNHTAHACDGEMLIIECPSRTSVAVLSAFYGRRVPNKYLCPSASTNTTVEEDIECTSSVAVEVNCMRPEWLWSDFCFPKKLPEWLLLQNAQSARIYLHLQKVLSECQDKQSCHIPVLSPVFGQDPCPLTNKYLLVSYKCQPGTPLSMCSQNTPLITVFWCLNLSRHVSHFKKKKIKHQRSLLTSTIVWHDNTKMKSLSCYFIYIIVE